MPASKNSKTRQSFELLLAVLIAGLVCYAAADWFTSRGYFLYYGDAEAHLNIARRIFDSRTPGLEQTGTVWLPLPHWILIPFVQYDDWWRTGLAGAIPAAIATALAAVFLFAAARRVFDNAAAGFAALGVFLLNPNLLYLGSSPMTEPFFFLSLFALLYFSMPAAETGSWLASAAAGLFACFGTLARYEAWLLIPFVTLYLLVRRRWGQAILFGAVASAGPLFWLGYNHFYYTDPLEFFRGPYSAQAIYRRALDAGMKRAPGDHDWPNAWLYFRSAAALAAGSTLGWLAAAGTLAALWKRAWWPLVLLSLPPLFYVWSLYSSGSSGTPVFIPQLPPWTYYNTRYGLAALPLLAFTAAALVALFPRARAPALLLVVLLAALPWLLHPRPEDWICWKESQVNSQARRAWTAEAAAYLRQHYTGGGIFTSFGDLTGIFRRAGIPLRDTLHEGNSTEWQARTLRPDLFLREEWAVAISGDAVATTLLRAQRKGPRYDCVKMIVVKGAPVIEIYRRGSQIP